MNDAEVVHGKRIKQVNAQNKATLCQIKLLAYLRLMWRFTWFILLFRR